ncbi:MAG: helix-turn-helix domain-containing protein [Streptosporangiaceae bacterium]
MTSRWSAAARAVLDDLDKHLFATVPEAAAVLRSDPRSVRRSIAAGDIPCTRVGARTLIPTAWIRQQAEGNAGVPERTTARDELAGDKPCVEPARARRAVRT